MMKRIVAIILAFLFLISLPACDAHNMKHFDAKAPSCTEPGHTAYDACTDEGCDLRIGYREISPKGHNMVSFSEKAATPDADGHTAYTACITCGYTEGYEVIKYSPDQDGDGDTHGGLLPPISVNIPTLEKRPIVRDLALEDQAMIRELYDAVMGFERKHQLSRTVSVSDINRYMFILNYCCPDIMQINGEFSYEHNGDAVSSVSFTYIMTLDEYIKNYDAVMDIVGSVANTVKDRTELEKERFIYDFIIDTSTYNKTTKHSCNSYGLLVERRARCEGYSKTFSLMMWAVGIDCYTVWGYAGEAHSWNVVKLGDKYYFADPTWDDQDGSRTHYGYFNVDLNTMTRANHTLHSHLSGLLPTCDSIDMSVPFLEGTYIDASQNVRERLGEIIATATENGKTEIYIKVANSLQYSTLENAAMKTAVDYLSANYKDHSVDVIFEDACMVCCMSLSYGEKK